VTDRIPNALRQYAEAVRERGARLAQASLGPGRSGRRIDDLARKSHSELDQMMEGAFSALPGSGGIACAPGCHHCCNLLVAVSPVEAFAIAHRLRDELPVDSALRARISGRAFETSPVSPDRAGDPAAEDILAERRTISCPMLAEGRCLIYSSRPIACRGCVSADAALCAARDVDKPVPRSVVHMLGAAGMMMGLMDALASLGLVGRPVELCSGVWLALCEEDAERRWLRGEDVFARLAGLVTE
jgi:hypothetical protein